MARVNPGVRNWADDLNTDLDGIEGNINTHKALATGAHAASAIALEPTGPITATNLQDAIGQFADITDAVLSGEDGAISVLVEDPGSDTRVAIDGVIGLSQIMFLPETYGAVGNGIADDRVAIQAAIDAAADGGGMVALGKGKMYGWTGIITVKNGVYLVGTATRQNLAPTDAASIPGLVALSATAQLRVGDWSTDPAPGGASCLYVDGNNVGGAFSLTKQGLVRICGVDVQIDRLFAVRSAGDGIVYDALQNSTVLGGGSTFHQGVAKVLDNGVGGVSFHGGYYGTSQDGALVFRDTTGETSLYPFGPLNNNWFGSLFESYDTADFPSPHTAHVHLRCGQSNTFYGCNFTGGADNTHNAVLRIDNADTFVPTSVRFDSCVWWSYPEHDVIRVVGNQIVGVTGNQYIADNGTDHALSFFCIDAGIPHISAEGEFLKASSSTPMYRTINGGLTVECYTRHEGGWSNLMNASQVFSFRRFDDTGHRMYVDQDGTLVWYDGTLASPVKGFLGKGTDTGVYVDGGTFDIRAGVKVAGPVDTPAAPWVYPAGTSSQTFDAALFRNWRAVWLSGGNTTFTFTNPAEGRELSLKLYAAFGTTPVITWPSSIIWGPSGAPPLTVGTLTTITFQYDSVFSQWHEISRSG